MISVEAQKRRTTKINAQRAAERAAAWAERSEPLREGAAMLCSARASDEASGRLWLWGAHRLPRAIATRYILFTHDSWSKDEQDLASLAFRAAANRLGVGNGTAPRNWAEAEAMLRTGWVPS